MRLRQTQIIGIMILSGLILFVLLEKLILRGDIATQHLNQIFAAPVWHEPLGTDQFGRSNAARLADAILNSLLMAVLCVVTSACSGVLSGVLAGWKKGGYDRCFSLLVNLIMALPGLVLILLFGAIFPGSFLFLFLGISLTMWADYFRVIRHKTALVVDADAFESSRLFGFGRWYLLKRHIWPSIRADVYTLSCFGAGNAILALAAMGFLYVGLRPPQAELGVMMVELFRYYDEAFWVLLQPTAVVALLIVAFHLLSPQQGE